MHELGIMYNIVERVLKVVDDNGLSEVEAIVLQVGDQSGVVPSYLHACYPAAVDGTMLADTLLEVEELAANAVCRSCGKTFAVSVNKGVCPGCKSGECEVVCGHELIIKEIRAR